MKSGRSRWVPSLASIVLLVGVAGGAWILRDYDPAQGSRLPACRFNQWTGLQCPGCGVTRATHHLLNGRWWEAFYFNAFFVTVLPVAALWAGWWLHRWQSDRPLSRRAFLVNAWLGGVVLSVWMVFWLVRNLPGWPLL
ncbi:MAG: DUF2752 domain-containing protein [Verrucomicrobiales bacterium]